MAERRTGGTAEQSGNYEDGEEERRPVVDPQQFAEVKTWLQEVFHLVGREVPSFEYTPRTIAELHRISTMSRRRTKIADIMAKDLRERSGEFRREAVRLKELLNGIGLGQENFSQAASNSIHALAATADHLDLKDAQISSYFVAMADLSLKMAEVREKREKARRESASMLDHTRKAIARLTQLKRLWSQLEEEAAMQNGPMSKWQEFVGMMASKERQYKQQLQNYQNILMRAGYTPEIAHGTLLEAAARHTQLVKSTEPVLGTLRSYQDLPPVSHLLVGAAPACSLVGGLSMDVAATGFPVIL
ncbi:hypothetical protein CBR_g38257 [Chara braunii]|uniref:Uncharacterized protein n=1 Tax=Chara braunii TaxID=69332 RepID=A0A388LPL4_CHABU|nr:hypothetical protein CBR_g38257 [Chara braunii]|eukprot:GBG84286.1 hypothetical protein CBR_g38257 [Chara braunii]